MDPCVSKTVSRPYEENSSILDAINRLVLENSEQSISSELVLALSNLPAEHGQFIQKFARRLHDACQKLLQPGSSITQKEEPKRLRIIDKLRLSGTIPRNVKADVDAMLSTFDHLKGGVIAADEAPNTDHDVQSFLDDNNSEINDAADQAASTVDSTLTPIDTMTTLSLIRDDVDDGARVGLFL